MKCVNLFAVLCIFLFVGGAVRAEAASLPVCETGPVWIFAGDNGMVRKLPESGGPKFALVKEIYTTSGDSVLRSRFWWWCIPGFRIDSGWDAEIEMSSEFGTHMTLASDSGAVTFFPCRNLVACMEEASRRYPDAVVRRAAP